MHHVTINKHRGLLAHKVAIEAAAAAIQLASNIPAPMRCLADQVIRSASSVPANLAEGAGRTGRDRKHHWRIAYASALEVGSHLELLKRTRAIDVQSASEAIDLFDRVRALTWRLINPRR